MSEETPQEPQLNPPIKKIRAPRNSRKGTHYHEGRYLPTAEFTKLASDIAEQRLAEMTQEQAREMLSAMTRIALTPELLAEISTLVGNGVFPDVAARSLNVPPATFKNWMDRGEDLVARQLYVSDTDPEGLQAQLYLLVSNRDAEHEIAMLGKFHERIEGDKDYRGAAWMLERHWPQRWSKRDIALGSGDNVEKPILNRMKEKARKLAEQKAIEDSKR